MKINCLLVDDEPLALDVLASYCRRVEGLEVVDRCTNPLQAFDLLQTQHIDLLFLDIQMPRLNGFEFLETLQHPPKVIFTTAYREYAIEAFEVDAVDYLIKPISFSRFLKAVSKAFQLLQASTDPVALRQQTPQPVSTAPEEPVHLDAMEFIFVKADKKMVKVFLKDILYIESLKDYVIIHTPDRRVVTKQKISYLEQKLPEERFLRIHRSFLIAVDKIEAFTTSSVEIKGKELPIGRSYKSEVNKVLEV